MYDFLYVSKALEEEILHMTAYDCSMEQDTCLVLVLSPPTRCVTLTSVRLGHFSLSKKRALCGCVLVWFLLEGYELVISARCWSSGL